MQKRIRTHHFHIYS